jgi:hypothetical protein
MVPSPTEQWQQLMKREVSRKQFLKYIGVTGIAAVGLLPLVQMLDRSAQQPAGRSGDYSSDGYGGFLGAGGVSGNRSKGFDQ